MVAADRFLMDRYTSTALNAITLHPHLIAMTAQLLGEECEELRLTQSVLWGEQILVEDLR